MSKRPKKKQKRARRAADRRNWVVILALVAITLSLGSLAFATQKYGQTAFARDTEIVQTSDRN